MERHKCKLCSRSFTNGRALGGHMKAHLATLPLPPKPEQKQQPFPTSLSFSSSESESEQEDEVLALREAEEKALIYELRENPKKSSRLADPKFSFAAPDTASSVLVVQDRESETESKNPTRQRSKRNRRNQNRNSEPRKVKLSFTAVLSTSSPEPPLSSVSDTSPEEDVAMCLMMLSRDNWNNHNGGLCSSSKEIKFKRVRGKLVCENCGKAFRSSRALASHRSVCSVDDEKTGNGGGDEKIFECPFCYKVFGSGQALGGHKRSHLVQPSSSNANNVGSARLKQSLIDLNLPAPPEEDDLSVVSYA